MYSKIRPEAFYKKTDLDGVEIIPFKTAVVGTAIRYDSSRREVIVDLGFSWIGIIPEEEATIYKLTYSADRTVSQQISFIIGTQIRAIVTEVKENKTLILSRKMSMIQAWNAVIEGQDLEACITKNIGYGVFLDLGNGLVSYNSRLECTSHEVSNTNIWYKVGDYVKAKLLDKGEETSSKIICSIKLAYPSFEELKQTIHPGDVIVVRIGATRVNEDGYFCEINPRVNGIIDADVKLEEGQLVRATVKNFGNKGLKLRYFG